MPSVHRLSPQDVFDDLQWMRKEHQREYLAMYSSWFGGVLRDPPFMLLPMDDHLVHRGDGVFEAVKLVPGGIYLLERHLDRLQRSADMISLPWPVNRKELKNIILETVRAAETDWGCVRLFISRGPGDFSPSPGGSIGSQLYIVVTTLSSPSSTAMEQGCSLYTSNLPVKPGPLAKVKSCSYLSSVLMVQEAMDRGVDFTISRDEEGRLGEGATDSFGIITQQEEFVVPSSPHLLDGTSVARAMELAQGFVPDGGLRAVEERRLYAEDFMAAKEILVFATTLDVLPVVEFDGQRIGDGQPGPWSRCFFELLQRDMEPGSESLTSLNQR